MNESSTIEEFKEKMVVEPAVKVKKRKKFIIEYEDGTTEEHDNGILFTMVEQKNDEGLTFLRMEGKHINTWEYKDAYAMGISRVAMEMLDEEKEAKMFGEK